jgi:hypothetical protein
MLHPEMDPRNYQATANYQGPLPYAGWSFSPPVAPMAPPPPPTAQPVGPPIATVTLPIGPLLAAMLCAVVVGGAVTAALITGQPAFQNASANAERANRLDQIQQQICR